VTAPSRTRSIPLGARILAAVALPFAIVAIVESVRDFWREGTSRWGSASLWISLALLAWSIVLRSRAESRA
jgi:hypothetical protein